MEQTYKTKIFRSSVKNPHFADNYFCVSRLSCHIADNVNTFQASRIYIVNPEPKRRLYFTRFNEENMSLEPYETDSNKQRAYYLNCRLREWSEIVNVGWKKKAFSVIFLTLTLPEIHENPDIRTFINHYKIKIKRKYGLDILTYFWVLEFGKNGRNPHYHIAMVTDRTNELSNFCPCNNPQHNDKGCLGLWTGFVKTEFVRKDVVRYCSKYFQKGTLMVFNHRRFGLANRTCKVKMIK